MNPIHELLCSLGVCDDAHAERIQEFVRDRDDVNVMRCNKSGVIFLDRVDHIDPTHYDNKAPTHRYGTSKRDIIRTNDDTERRFQSFRNEVRGKSWLDFGAGSGAILDRLAPLSKSAAAVEPQQEAANFLTALGHTVYRRLEDVPAQGFDIITLFHVLEHLSNPVEILSGLKKKLSSNGRIFIEVPHARDFLIAFADNPAFKAHTFWSEHLILHTRESLRAIIQHSGLNIRAITAVQRYPLANHLFWLIEGKAGGHEKWSSLRDSALDEAWANTLARLDHTDTLMAEAYLDE